MRASCGPPAIASTSNGCCRFAAGCGTHAARLTARPRTGRLVVKAVSHCDHSVRLRGDAKSVHRYISDLCRWSEWHPGVVRGARLDAAPDAPVRRGSRFQLRQRVLVYEFDVDYEVLEHDPGRRLVLSGLSDTHACQDTFVLMPDRADPSGHAVLRHLHDQRLRAWRAALQPVAGKALEAASEAALAALRRRLQGADSPLRGAHHHHHHQQRGRASSPPPPPPPPPQSAGWPLGGGASPFCSGSDSDWGGAFTNLLGAAARGAAAAAVAAAKSSAAAAAAGDPLGYYAALGLRVRGDGAGRRVTQEQLRAAYRAAAARLHPDRHLRADERQRQQAASRYAAVMAAWDVLRDPDARAAYDAGVLPAVVAAREGGQQQQQQQ